MVDLSPEKEPRAQVSVSSLVCEGLGLLYQALQYAADTLRDPWEFAVEIGELRAVGVTNADFRWLLCKGSLKHAREVPSVNGDQRRFVFGDSLRFCDRSCFQLTEQGVELAGSLFAGGLPNSLMPFDGIRSEPAGASGIKPVWDGERHQFFVCDQLVKEFKVPSPNQETILTAFQEEDWPIRIDDPLPPSLHADCKRRLHDTIKSLNRNQKQSLIRFMGDGTGEGVLWELTLPEEKPSPNGR